MIQIQQGSLERPYNSVFFQCICFYRLYENRTVTKWIIKIGFVLLCCFMSCLLPFLSFDVFYGLYSGGGRYLCFVMLLHVLSSTVFVELCVLWSVCRGVSVFSDVVLSFLILLGFYMVILIMIHLLPSMNVSLFLFVNSEPVVIASCHRVIAFAAFEGYR